MADAPPPPTEDAWEAARARARADVAAAYAPRPRTCPSCGREEVTAARSCPHCGASYVEVRPSRRPSRRAWVAVGLGAAALTAGLAFALPALHEGTEEQARRDRAEQARLAAAERRRQLREARPRFARTAVRARPAMVAAVERAITADARARVRAGVIDGPIGGTECEPYPPIEDRRRAEADPRTRRGRYECVAYKSRFPLSELEGRERTGLFGYLFYAVVRYREGRFAWCKISVRAGEGARTLASIPVPRPCRG